MAQFIRTEEGTGIQLFVSQEDRHLLPYAHRPELMLLKCETETGDAEVIWQLKFHQGEESPAASDVEIGRAGGIHWEIWPEDAEAIRDDCAALFDRLTAEQPADLDALRVILRDGGIKDYTDRTRD